MRLTHKMMTHCGTLALVLAGGLSLLTAATSCIKDEPLNAECDLEQVTLHAAQPAEVFFNAADSVRTVLSTDSVVTVAVRRTAPLETVTPSFTVTEGATVQSTGPVTEGGAAVWSVTVTSQDGQWHRGYTVRLVPTARTVADTVAYDFEHFELESKSQKYYVWHNVRPDGTLADDWATANGGFQLSMGSALPGEYPTVPVEGVEGYGVQLRTCDTGPFGVMVNKRIAAGNMFLGTFDITSALRNPMQATCFGIAFDMKPVKLTGYYRYTPGTKYQDRDGNEMTGVTDSASIYSVLYLNRDAQGNAVTLHGDDVLTHANQVAVAKLNPVQATSEWTYFEVEFAYSKELDETLLANMGYSLTIVLSSSSEGDKFCGAIGSTLQVDKLRLVCTAQE